MATTAKVPHKYKYIHDKVGYNYRMPNINAAIGLAQLEKLSLLLEAKRQLGVKYQSLVANIAGVDCLSQSMRTQWNHWLNVIVFDSAEDAKVFIKQCHQSNILVRPAWKLMHQLKAFMGDYCLPIAENIASRLVVLPSGVSKVSG